MHGEEADADNVETSLTLKMKTWQELAAAHSWYILSNLTPLASHFQESEPVSSWKTPGFFFSTEGLKYL